MKLTNNKILITGGATGIGYGLAERFVKEGNSVIICGRRGDVLKEAAEKIPSLTLKVCDLSKDDQRVELFKWISDNHSDINVLINNAGIQHWMQITDPDFYKKAKEELQINIEAVIHLSSLFLNLKSLDTLINVSSGLSFSPLTKTPVYSATKAFIHSYTLTMRHLLKKRNVEVIELIPPALNTDLGGKGIHDFAPPVSGFIDSVFEQLKEGKPEITYGFSEQMANATPDEIRAAFERMNAL